MHSAIAFILAPLLGAIIFAATGAAPPDLAGIAAIITACIGVVGFLATLFRGKANNKRVEEVEQAASYVSGFEGLIKRLQEEVEDLHKEMSTESDKWTKERIQLLETIRTIRNELQEQIMTNNVTKSELAVMLGQIRGFLSPAQYEEFRKHVE